MANTDNQMDESMVHEIKFSLPKVRENACDQVVIGSISFFWLAKNKREIFCQLLTYERVF